jgi:hypothetical protein
MRKKMVKIQKNFGILKNPRNVENEKLNKSNTKDKRKASVKTESRRNTFVGTEKNKGEW